MLKCIELANIAKQRGESPVGSVVVKDGEIIGEGIEGGKTNKDITYHAEIEAIRNATKLLHHRIFHSAQCIQLMNLVLCVLMLSGIQRLIQ